MVNPLVGHISWAVPDNHTISVTLFKDSRTHELEDKDWTFIIEDVSKLSNEFNKEKKTVDSFVIVELVGMPEITLSA